MKRIGQLLFLLLIASAAQASVKDTLVNYPLPDSVKGVSLIADITTSGVNYKGNFQGGINTDAVTLSLSSLSKNRSVQFRYPYNAVVVAKGLSVNTGLKEGGLYFTYKWENDKPYRLLIATAADSAGNFSLYSGYVWLPTEEKWKLIGTCKINGRWNTLQSPAGFVRTAGRNAGQAQISNVWCQRNTGSWKQLAGTDTKTPLVNLFNHRDSLLQSQLEAQEIQKAIGAGTLDAKESNNGLYYTMLKEGNGKSFTANDTVTIHYKGYLFIDGTVFDQTKEKPATFPLKRLIRGWQLGVPLCKTGGKIKLVIPSGLAYSIRTRAAKIPPNSILVFEIEVLDVRPALSQ